MSPTPFELVAVYGQIVLAVVSLFIAILYNEAQIRVMRSDWGYASALRHVLYTAVCCFALGSLLVLAAILFQSEITLMGGSGSIPTLLVAVLMVAYKWGSEPCSIWDIHLLQENVIDFSRITRWKEGTGLSSKQSRIVSKWLREVKKMLLALVWVFPPPEAATMFGGHEDRVILSSKMPPLLLKSPDYPLLAAMVKQYTWKIVCVCETSHQEFYAGLRLLKFAHSNSGMGSSPTDALLFYSKLLALLVRGKHAFKERYEQYYDDLKVLRARKQRTVTPPTNTEVVLEWLYNNQRLNSELRHWDDYSFKSEVEEMLAVCPRSSGYWEVLVKLAEATGCRDWRSTYKKLTSQESLRTVFILFAMEVKKATSHRVHSIISARKHFFDRSQNYIRWLVSSEEVELNGLYAMLASENVQNMADIVMLTFLIVGRGWDEQAEVEPPI